MGNEMKERNGGIALIPFGLFIFLIVGTGIILDRMGVEKPFYQLPASTAAFAAIVAAFILYKGSVEEKMNSFFRGCANENVAVMYMTCFLAGSFAEVAKASGGVDAVVNFCLSIMPPAYLTLGMFVVAAFMSLATGSSSGTVAALGAIACSVGAKAGLNMAMLLAAVLSGAFFGDNLSIISDTTIVAARTQGCEMKDKFKINFYIAVPAAIITAILYFVFGKPETVVEVQAGTYSLIKILPYLYVLVMSIVGMNVFVVLGSGTILAGVIGMSTGSINLISFGQTIYSGFSGMTEIVLLAIFIGGLSNMMAEQDGLNYLMKRIRKLVKGRKSAEIGIAVLVSAADVAVANNTAAIIVSGDIAKEISCEYKVDPRRSASILSIFSCVAQGLIPYGNQILLIGVLASGAVAPVEIIPYMWYVVILGVFAVVSTFVPYADSLLKREPWKWEDEKTK